MIKVRKTRLDRSLIVPIAGEGAIAGSTAEGRLIPVLILDANGREDITELIRIHAFLVPGDVRSQWGTSREDKDHVILALGFSAPMELELAVSLSIEHQGILVETMLVSGAVYLQSGAPGDRVSDNVEAPKVLVELPDTGFRSIWDDLYLDRMTKAMAKQLGVSRRKAQPAAEIFVGEMRNLARLRLKL